MTETPINEAIEQQPHAITRELLEADRLRRMIVANSPGTRVLDDAELQRSIDGTLARRPAPAATVDGVWVFGYGSLPWNPCIEVAERRTVHVHGYHRDFCLAETEGRGSPQWPGLTLALAPGGACRGIGLRIPARGLRHELLLLWRREMVTGVYAPRWVRMRTHEEAIDGIAFVANRAHPAWVGRLPEQEKARRIATGRGPIGRCAEYLERTVDLLEQHDIHDRYLARLRNRVRAMAM